MILCVSVEEMKAAIWLSLVTLSLAVADLDYLKGFDDSVLYKIAWPGSEGENSENLSGMESMTVTSNKNEKYSCFLPNIEDKGLSSGKDYSGPTPMDLLTPLFASSPCTTVIDSYWSYELCHGKYIRQYHDTVVGGQGKNDKPQIHTLEYFLGYWNGKKTKAMISELELQKASGQNINPPTKKIEGVDIPYFQMNYTDGTLCDLTGDFRRASVLYVCILGAKSDVFILEEVSTCQYEVIVTRAELCKHPRYRPKQSEENEIKCLPVQGAPQKPFGLLTMEAKMMKNRMHKEFPLALGDKDENVVAMFSIEEFVDEYGQTKFKILLKGMEDGQDDAAKSLLKDLNAKVETPSAAEFLNGAFCPVGKSENGEMEYTFCFGKHVLKTHHVEGNPPKITTLGAWNENAHIVWLKNNPKKRPNPPYSVTYLYTGGDICPETGLPRQTEVRLKCTQADGISLFILEPKTCQYIVGVESSMICEFVNKLDEYGLLKK